MTRREVIPMNDIPGLRLAPMRMIALVGQSGRQLDSVSPTSTPAERHAAGSSDPRVLAALPLEVTERTITNADTTPALQTRVARFTSNNSERMGDADDGPEREFSFGEFLDIINPLHHIPIVGTIYRAITGDEISPSASIFGGFLFGGPLGFVTTIANAIFEEASGQDLGETALAALVGDEPEPDTQVAAAAPNIESDNPLEAAEPAQASRGQGTAKENELPSIARVSRTFESRAPNPAAISHGTDPSNGAPAPVELAEGTSPHPMVVPIPGLAPEQPAAAPGAPNQSGHPLSAMPGDRAFAEQMRHALDKYKAIVISRNRDSERAARGIDLKL